MESCSPAALDHLLAIASSSPVDLEIEANSSGIGVRLLKPALFFHHSFVSGSLARRARQSNQALLKACNNKSRSIEKVLDLTAGWGADSLSLANHGQQVTMVEHNSLVFAVVACSWEVLAQDPANAGTARRMFLENVDAGDYLRGLDATQGFDCIYFDPMFPAHKSSAKPAKEMQILQALTDNREIETVFDLALRQARKRVVVKRPAKAARLTDIEPDIVYREKTIRFDVYLTA